MNSTNPFLQQPLVGSPTHPFFPPSSAVEMHRIDSNEVQTKLNDALLFATKKSDHFAVRQLLEKGADPNIPAGNGTPPLHYAAQKGHTEIVESLLLKGAQINALGCNGNTTLHFATKKGQTGAIQVLLSLGANPDVRNDKGETPLYLAMSNNKVDKDIVTLLFDHKANPNIAANSGFTPLTLNTSFPDITELLLKHGADPNHQTPQEGYTALHFASKKGQTRTIRVLLSLGANPDVKNDKSETPLYLAMLSNKDIVTLLLDHKANPNIAANSGFTPLTLNTSFPDITELLLKHGADPNHQTPQEGYTALHFATKKGQTGTIQVLLSWGANPDVKNDKGETPLYLAMSRNKVDKDIVTLLLDHKANPNIACSSGFTPLTLNIAFPDITELLLQHGADPNHQTPQEGYTALHFATKKGQTGTIQVLLSWGANPDVRNDKGKTPLQLMKRLDNCALF